MLRKIEISGLYSFGIETQIADFTAKTKSKFFKFTTNIFNSKRSTPRE